MGERAAPVHLASLTKTWKNSNPRHGKCVPKATTSWLNGNEARFRQHSEFTARDIQEAVIQSARPEAKEQLRRRFGFFLDALTYGTPLRTAESR